MACNTSEVESIFSCIKAQPFSLLSSICPEGHRLTVPSGGFVSGIKQAQSVWHIRAPIHLGMQPVLLLSAAPQCFLPSPSCPAHSPKLQGSSGFGAPGHGAKGTGILANTIDVDTPYPSSSPSRPRPPACNTATATGRDQNRTKQNRTQGPAGPACLRCGRLDAAYLDY